MLRRFNDFIKEASIVGNPGIPGEQEGGRRKGDYLKGLEDEAKRRHGVTGREMPHEIGQLLMEMGRIAGQAKRNTQGKNKQLEELAKEVIMSEFGEILDGVYLDLKIEDRENIQKMMDEECEESASWVTQTNRSFLPSLPKVTAGDGGVLTPGSTDPERKNGSFRRCTGFLVSSFWPWWRWAWRFISSASSRG